MLNSVSKCVLTSGFYRRFDAPSTNRAVTLAFGRSSDLPSEDFQHPRRSVDRFLRAAMEENIPDTGIGSPKRGDGDISAFVFKPRLIHP